MLSTFDIWVVMLNNVFGVVVFLRFGYAVGHAGNDSFTFILCVHVCIYIYLFICKKIELNIVDAYEYDAYDAYDVHDEYEWKCV